MAHIVQQNAQHNPPLNSQTSIYQYYREALEYFNDTHDEARLANEIHQLRSRALTTGTDRDRMRRGAVRHLVMALHDYQQNTIVDMDEDENNPTVHHAPATPVETAGQVRQRGAAAPHAQAPHHQTGFHGNGIAPTPPPPAFTYKGPPFPGSQVDQYGQRSGTRYYGKPPPSKGGMIKSGGKKTKAQLDAENASFARQVEEGGLDRAYYPTTGKKKTKAQVDAENASFAKQAEEGGLDKAHYPKKEGGKGVGSQLTYCVKCKTKRSMLHPACGMTSNHKRCMKGVCSVCGTKMIRFC